MMFAATNVQIGPMIQKLSRTFCPEPNLLEVIS